MYGLAESLAQGLMRLKSRSRLGLPFHPRTWDLFQPHWSWAGFGSLWLYDRCPCFLAGCQPGTTIGPAAAPLSDVFHL